MKRPELDFVMVGLTSLSGMKDGLESSFQILSQADRDRAVRFRRDEDRHRFVIGRALLAKLLRDELGREAAPLDLDLTEHGRPYLSAEPWIHFNIAHARDWVGVALSTDTRVGVDVESLDRRLDLDPLAERIFNPADLARFRALPDADKTRAFFRAWTGKEAVLKAQGTGLFGGVQSISVPLDEHAGVVQAGTAIWQLQPVIMPDGYTGAVAWDDPRKRVRVARIELS